MEKEVIVRTACTGMTVYIAVMLTHRSFEANPVVKADEILGGPAISTFEHAEFLLKYKLDLTVQKSEHTYVLTKATDAFPDHFSSGHYDRCFGEILENYLSLADWAGDVPTMRILFKAPPAHAEILSDLTNLGYLKSSENGLLWTDLVGPAMLCAGAWNPKFHSHQEVEDYERETLAQKIANNLDRDLLLLAQTDQREAFWPIYYNLCGEAWYQTADKLLVERVIEIARSR